MFLETIKVKNKRFHNLDLHQNRVTKTQKDKFTISTCISLKKQVEIPKQLDEKLYKCRVVYDTEIQNIEFLPYTIPKIETLQIIYTKNMAYEYKFLDRKNLDKLYQNRGNKDDIIISQNGFVQDSYYGNLLFSDGKQYFTPKNPLLKGTQRAKLLQEAKVLAKEIQVSDISNFVFIKIINAMLDLEDAPKIDIKKVYF